MAKITSVKLKIEPTNRAELYKVTVSFKHAYKDPEYGKKFQYAIRLRSSEIYLGNHDIESSPSVRYPFKFGNSTTKTFTALPTTQSPISVSRMVPAHILDEDPPHPTGPNGETAPSVDDIFAVVVLLRVEGQFVVVVDKKRSNVVFLTI